MFDPLRPLKYLPWLQLLQVSLIAVAIGVCLDVLIVSALSFSPPAATRPVIQVLQTIPGLLLQLGVSAGIGALGVIVLERWFRKFSITNSILWALVPCLLLWLGVWAVLKSLLSLPGLFLPDLDTLVLVGIILGVFWKGKAYWR